MSCCLFAKLGPAVHVSHGVLCVTLCQSRSRPAADFSPALVGPASSNGICVTAQWQATQWLLAPAVPGPRCDSCRVPNPPVQATPGLLRFLHADETVQVDVCMQQCDAVGLSSACAAPAVLAQIDLPNLLNFDYQVCGHVCKGGRSYLAWCFRLGCSLRLPCAGSAGGT